MPPKVNKSVVILLFYLLLGMLVGCTDPARETRNVELTGLRVSDVLGADDAQVFLKAGEIKPFEFPRDHGKHPDYRSEWWYLTMNLRGNDGRLFGVQFTLFRQAFLAAPEGSSPWQSGQAYLAHFALTDVQEDAHYSDQRFARHHPANADVTLKPRFLAQIEDWKLAQDQDGSPWRLTLQAVGESQTEGLVGKGVPFAVALNLQASSPPVLQGDHGLSRKGPGQASYYYSIPRLTTAGTVQVGEAVYAVEGLAWMDREWSTSVLSPGVVGWDWMSLHLFDGRDVMAFRLRRADGERDPYDHGLLSTQGQRRVLHSADFSLEPIRYWRDQSGVLWPVSWLLTLHDGSDVFEVRALVDDQIMSHGLVYWEGLVEVVDRSQATIAGYGYLELTGYGDQ